MAACTKQEVINELVTGYECEEPVAKAAVENFYAWTHMKLPKKVAEGDLEETAEYVYAQSRFWEE